MFKVGIIGLGGMGQKMLSDMAVHSQFNAAFGWDPSSESCAEAKSAFPDLVIANNPEDIIADTNIDVLYISSRIFSQRH